MSTLRLKVFNPDGSEKGEYAITGIEPFTPGWYIVYLENGMLTYLTRNELNRQFGVDWWALVKQGLGVQDWAGRTPTL